MARPSSAKQPALENDHGVPIHNICLIPRNLLQLDVAVGPATGTAC